MQPANEKIQRVLEMARAATSGLNPDLALEQLRHVWVDVESLGDCPLRAEYEIANADALAAKNDRAALVYYDNAIGVLGRLPEHCPLIELRVRFNRANCLGLFGVFSEARREYEAALRIATERKLPEDVAKIRLRLIHIDLKLDESSMLEGWTVFKKVANARGCTCETQLAAWMLHCDRVNQSATGRQFARNADKPTEKYFEQLLGTIRAIPR